MAGDAKIVVFDFNKLGEAAKALVTRSFDWAERATEGKIQVDLAHARAAVARIDASSAIEISSLRQRAERQSVADAVRHLDNKEKIVTKALQNLDPNAKPEGIEEDWLHNYFEKCRNISDEEMQTVWAKVLAGEANGAGRFSKRTIAALAELDKKDAESFALLARFVVTIGPQIYPLLTDYRAAIYKNAGVTFELVHHLNSIGLIDANDLSGYRLTFNDEAEATYVGYGGEHFPVYFKDNNKVINIGKLMFTRVGSELFRVCSAEPIPEFLTHLKSYWSNHLEKPPSPN